jgi:transposase
VQSSRRLEREAQQNVELMWLTGRLAPDFKTIADFRKDHGDAIRKVCREFVVLYRRLKLFADGAPRVLPPETATTRCAPTASSRAAASP